MTHYKFIIRIRSPIYFPANNRLSFQYGRSLEKDKYVSIRIRKYKSCIRVYKQVVFFN